MSQEPQPDVKPEGYLSLSPNPFSFDFESRPRTRPSVADLPSVLLSALDLVCLMGMLQQQGDHQGRVQQRPRYAPFLPSLPPFAFPEDRTRLTGRYPIHTP
jgi:hypothetical protein